MLLDFDKNILINGDNLNGLKLIEELVLYDFILIDPPYRTENKTINYNDRLERTHWKREIKERLEKSLPLLKEDGAIAVHIDDKEYASLRMIMDEVFGEENYVNTFILKRGTKNINNQFEKIASLNRAFEFLVVYKKGHEFYYKNPFKSSTKKRQEGHWTSFKSNTDRPTMRYEIDGIMINEGQWKWSKERGLRALGNYKKYQEKYGREYSLKEYWESFRDQYLKETGTTLEFVRRNKSSVQYWVQPSDRVLMDTNMMNYCINDILGKGKYGFDTVKNLDTIKKIISIFTEKDSKVLDFYAETGIIGHAVMELNAEDGGSRKFTLITNDDNEINSSICKPKIEKISKQYNENFQYIVIE